MKPIKDYESCYTITTAGEVYRVGSTRPLTPTINPQNGYLYVSLWQNNKGKTFSVHRLVALHFIDNPENKPAVNHIDSNRVNPHRDNLEWCTQAENIQHGYDFGNMSQEFRKNLNKFEFSLLLTSFLSGISLTAIAEQISCGLTSVAKWMRYTATEEGKLAEYEAELKQQKTLRNRNATAKFRLPVLQYTKEGVYITEHESVTAAATALNKTSSGTISNALNPLRSQISAYGYLWKYK